MRRKEQYIPEKEARSILAQHSHGVLSLVDGVRPYAVPINYAFVEGRLLFHTGHLGKKMEIIEQNPAASFCVIARSDIVLNELTTDYLSVVVTGKLVRLEDTESAIRKFMQHYEPINADQLEKEIVKYRRALVMLELEIEQISGKEGRIATMRRK